MDILKKTVRLLRNCVEIYIPAISFLIMFFVYLFQVFMRYVVRAPQSWTMEVTSMTFLWLVLLGACFAQRSRSHVTFTLIYDQLGIRGKALTAFAGNLIIAFTFLVCLRPTWDFILFQTSAQQVTSILKISKTIVYAPYMLFLGIIILYTLVDLAHDFMVLTGLGGEAAQEVLLRETRSEVEQIIEASTEQTPPEEKEDT